MGGCTTLKVKKWSAVSCLCLLYVGLMLDVEENMAYRVLYLIAFFKENCFCARKSTQRMLFGTLLESQLCLWEIGFGMVPGQLIALPVEKVTGRFVGLCNLLFNTV